MSETLPGAERVLQHERAAGFLGRLAFEWNSYRLHMLSITATGLKEGTLSPNRKGVEGEVRSGSDHVLVRSSRRTPDGISTTEVTLAWGEEKDPHVLPKEIHARETVEALYDSSQPPRVRTFPMSEVGPHEGYIGLGEISHELDLVHVAQLHSVDRH